MILHCIACFPVSNRWTSIRQRYTALFCVRIAAVWKWNVQWVACLYKWNKCNAVPGELSNNFTVWKAAHTDLVMQCYELQNVLFYKICTMVKAFEVITSYCARNCTKMYLIYYAINCPCNHNLWTGTIVFYVTSVKFSWKLQWICIDRFLKLSKNVGKGNEPIIIRFHNKITFPIGLCGSTTMEAMIKQTNIKKQKRVWMHSSSLCSCFC